MFFLSTQLFVSTTVQVIYWRPCSTWCMSLLFLPVCPWLHVAQTSSGDVSSLSAVLLALSTCLHREMGMLLIRPQLIPTLWQLLGLPLVGPQRGTQDMQDAVVGPGHTTVLFDQLHSFTQSNTVQPSLQAAQLVLLQL